MPDVTYEPLEVAKVLDRTTPENPAG